MIDIKLLKPFKQTDDSRCGPACIKMVLGYYGIEATEDEICERCNHTYELGCTDSQMKEAIESYGLRCAIRNESSLKEIEMLLDLGFILIVDYLTTGINPSLEDMPEGHSSIVVGLDEERIHLLDPELGGVRSIKHSDFLRAWIDWREDPYLQRCSDLILRQVMIIEK